MDLRAAVEACQFHKWTQFFPRNRFKSRQICIPEQFRTFLTSDCLIVPSPTAEDEALRSPALLSLVEDIQHVIDELGAVVPKANWSVPW